MAKTTEQLLQQAVQIRDEQANKKNTALRVGTLFSDIIEKQDEDVTALDKSVKDNKEKLTELGNEIKDIVSENVYNLKSEINNLSEEKANKDEVYTRTQIDEKIGAVKDDRVDDLVVDINKAKEDISNNQEAIKRLNDGGLNLKDELISQEVQEWLNEHPEASTTVDFRIVTKIFSHVEALVSDMSLKDGDIVKTLGYRSIGDNGGADYTISDIASGLMPIALKNGKYANIRISNRYYNAKQFGLIADGSMHRISDINNSISLEEVSSLSPAATLQNSYDWYILAYLIKNVPDYSSIILDGNLVIDEKIEIRRSHFRVKSLIQDIHNGSGLNNVATINYTKADCITDLFEFIENGDNIAFEHLYIVGTHNASDNSYSGDCFGINTSVIGLILDNVWVSRFKNGLIGSKRSHFVASLIKDCTFQSCVENGIYLRSDNISQVNSSSFIRVSGYYCGKMPDGSYNNGDYGLINISGMGLYIESIQANLSKAGLIVNDGICKGIVVDTIYVEQNNINVKIAERGLKEGVSIRGILDSDINKIECPDALVRSIFPDYAALINYYSNNVELSDDSFIIHRIEGTPIFEGRQWYEYPKSKNYTLFSVRLRDNWRKVTVSYDYKHNNTDRGDDYDFMRLSDFTYNEPTGKNIFTGFQYVYALGKNDVLYGVIKAISVVKKEDETHDIELSSPLPADANGIFVNCINTRNYSRFEFFNRKKNAQLGGLKFLFRLLEGDFEISADRMKISIKTTSVYFPSFATLSEYSTYITPVKRSVDTPKIQNDFFFINHAANGNGKSGTYSITLDLDDTDNKYADKLNDGMSSVVKYLLISKALDRMPDGQTFLISNIKVSGE